ncbi:uncharacterized protein LOC135831202 [Planococcus citri]|uniref:uncharacterized protein LOC135831202 n=1 Tax=Planococcus citri TaxID=170843 RepID=UPI0031F83F8B
MTSLFLTIFVGLVSVSGIAINAYIIFVITLAKQANTVNGMLLMQASVVELALSVSVLACSVPNMIRDNPLSSSSIGYCTFCGFLIGFLRPIAVWTVCGLNCDRYYAISAPLHYGSLISPRKVLMAMSATWISSLILGLPAIIPTIYRYRDATFFCTADFGRTTFSVYYSIVYTTFVFVLPLILVLTCNLKVFTIARYHKHRIASAIFEVTLSAQVTITHQKNPFSPSGLANRFKRRSASLTVFQIVGSFLVIYVPYYSVVLLDSTNTLLFSHNLNRNVIDIPPFLITIASVLLLCSSSINGILYGVKSKVLKKSFQNYWRKKMKKNELNQEIQARTPSTCGSRRPSLTPAMGFFGRQGMRRPSEVSIDTQKSNLLATSYPKFQCVNNFAWRPGSSPGLESSVPQNESFNDLKRTHSFRNSPTNHMNSLISLKIPNDKSKFDDLKNYRKCVTAINIAGDKPTTTKTTKNSTSATTTIVGGNANLILQRFRKVDGDYEALSRSSRCKSPKILITRAFSEENESTSDKSSLPKSSSSVTTLLIDTNWKSVSRECIAFNASSKNNALLMDYTDDSCSDESQDDAAEAKLSRSVRPVSFNIDTSDSDSNLGHGHNNSIKSWPFTNKKKNIQFRIGSVILSEREFSSVGDVTSKK